jgi:CDGSH-type Zn-finger protein
MVKIVSILSLLLLLAPASGFHTPLQTTRLAPLHEKINSKVDLDSAKVVNNEQLCAGDKKVYCRCWKSETFPLCDGAHVAHNKETGDNVGPLILSADAAAVESPSAANEEKVSVLGKFKKFLGFGSDKNADGLTTRERLAKMGLSALLSYGWVSNMSYAVTLSLSWYGFSKKVSICVKYYLDLVHNTHNPASILNHSRRPVYHL